MKNRQAYNKVLVDFLREIIFEYEDIRFFQAVVGFLMNNQHGNLDINRYYYEEPKDTLKRVEKYIVKVEENEYIERLNKLKEIYL